VGKRTRRIGGRRRALWVVLAEHLHVSAERDEAEQVFGLADLPAENLRPEAEGKPQNLHSACFGDEEVAELVDEDQYAENEDGGERVDYDGAHRFLTPPLPSPLAGDAKNIHVIIDQHDGKHETVRSIQHSPVAG
jgi:hypothetical protein